MDIKNKSYSSFITEWTYFSETELRYQSYSFLITTILDKELFQKNSDLHKILDGLVFENPLKEYLYASRTQLLARLVREFNKIKLQDLQKNIEMLIDYINDFTDGNDVRLKKNRSEVHQDQNKSKDMIQKNIELVNRYRRGNNNE